MPKAVTMAEFAEYFAYPLLLDEKKYHKTVKSAIETKRIYVMPDDASFKACVARYLAETVSSEPTGIALFGWGVWPSSEIPQLYERIRKSEGLNVDIAQYPCDICEIGETNYIMCQLAVAMYNIWDFVILTKSRSLEVYISHDEYIAIINGEDSKINDFLSRLRALGATTLRKEYLYKLWGFEE